MHIMKSYIQTAKKHAKEVISCSDLDNSGLVALDLCAIIACPLAIIAMVSAIFIESGQDPEGFITSPGCLLMAIISVLGTIPRASYRPMVDHAYRDNPKKEVLRGKLKAFMVASILVIMSALVTAIITLLLMLTTTEYQARGMAVGGVVLAIIVYSGFLVRSVLLIVKAKKKSVRVTDWD